MSVAALLVQVCVLVRRATPVRPTWSSTPQSPAEGLAAPGRACCDYSPSPGSTSSGARRRGRTYS